MGQTMKKDPPPNMNAIAAVITKHRDPEQWFSVAVNSDGNILGHGKGEDGNKGGGND